MKKHLLFTVVMLVINVAASAQDIIITTESKKIEAIIESVSDTEVHYKNLSNQTGPTFIMNTNKISSIIYSNGEVQAFSHQEVTNSVTESGLKIEKIDGRYILHDKEYDYLDMDKYQYRSYIYENCPMAYNQYISGERKVTAGKTLLGVGIVADIVGITLSVLGSKQDNKGCIIGGALFMSTGTILEIACIPTWIVGAHQRNKSVDIFNSQCAKQVSVEPYLSVNLSQIGVGLALNF